MRLWASAGVLRPSPKRWTRSTKRATRPTTNSLTERLRADGGNAPCPIDQAVVERFYRFEGPSDPGDQMIVFGVRDPVTGLRGSLAAAYGPAADPGLYDNLTRRLRTTSGRATAGAAVIGHVGDRA